MIKGIPLIAFDGTHASGKTTLKYGTAAKIKEHGINCSVLSEPARNSPLVDDVVLRDIGDFDLALEIDLIASHITQSIRATRNSALILSDRTPANVIAYTKLLVNIDNEMDKVLFSAVDKFVKAWLNIYDIVFYCCDYFSADLKNDKLRSKVNGIQKDVDIQTQKEYENAGIALEYIPLNLSNIERVDFVCNTLENKYNFFSRYNV